MTAWLVVNADDLGVSPGANLGILQAHQAGIVTSASLAVTTPFYEQALAICVDPCRELGIGLHFTLTSGTPASDPARVPLLVDAEGRLCWRFVPLLIAAGLRRERPLLEQIEREIEAQFQRLLRDGIRPDHINGERHVHLIPGIFERVAAAARRHGVRFVRVGRDAGPRYISPRGLPGLLAGGGFVKSWLLGGVSANQRVHLGSDLSSPARVASYLYTGRSDRILPTLLAAPPCPGITEVMVHPGQPEANGLLDLGNRELERYLRMADRRAELKSCVAARGRTGGWRLTHYRELTRLGVA